tara:strand:+ start:1246 stop:2232 length:987 start_codon:yes stop_codon:yes gene_type:complete
VKRIQSLDLFRGLAGYGVAVCHFYTYLDNSLLSEYISFLFVELFFVLSGFVLYPQLIKVYSNIKNFKIFIIRRWMRTLPVFFIAVICYSIIFKEYNNDTLKYLFFVQKSFPNFLLNDYIVVAWSLSIEEWFYLLFPIFLILFNKLKIKKIFLYFLFLIYILKLIFLINSQNFDFYRTGTFLRLDAILFGVIIAHYLELIKKIKFTNFLFFIFLFLYFSFFNFFNEKEYLNQFLYLILIQSISAFSLIFFININSIISKNFFNNFYSILANQTYSVYLFHFIIIYFIKFYELQEIKFIFAYYILILFLFSSFIFYIIEKSILSLRPNYK